MLLGRSASGLFWMARYTERAEATARLLDTGLHMVLTRGTRAADWHPVLAPAGLARTFEAKRGAPTVESVADFMLRDPENPGSIKAVFDAARSNARMVRTSLTREAWEATNDAWRRITDALREPVAPPDLPQVLGLIKQQTALIRGAFHNTMLRNEIFDFVQLGTYVERADMTARILDVKYHVLLPSVAWVGSALDTAQWEMILRSVSAHRSYRWIYGAETRPLDVVHFLVLNARMPRSLAHCNGVIETRLAALASDYGGTTPCHATAGAIRARFVDRDVASIFEEGLHEFLTAFMRDNARFADEVARDYAFTEAA